MLKKELENLARAYSYDPEGFVIGYTKGFELAMRLVTDKTTLQLMQRQLDKFK